MSVAFGARACEAARSRLWAPETHQTSDSVHGVTNLLERGKSCPLPSPILVDDLKHRRGSKPLQRRPIGQGGKRSDKARVVRLKIQDVSIGNNSNNRKQVVGERARGGGSCGPGRGVGPSIHGEAAMSIERKYRAWFLAIPSWCGPNVRPRPPAPLTPLRVSAPHERAVWTPMPNMRSNKLGSCQQ